MLTGAIYSIRKLYCLFVHEQKTKEAAVPGNYFTVKMVTSKGCYKCDLWKRAHDDSNCI